MLDMQPLSYIVITFSICAVAVQHISLSAYMAFLQCKQSFKFMQKSKISRFFIGNSIIFRLTDQESNISIKFTT